jgi:type VI secretion system secreted protein VgrG
MARVMEIVTPLGADVLLFHSMTAREEMSGLFAYRVDLLSPRDDINLDEILGKNVTIKLQLPHDETRFFNGYVTKFAQGGTLGRFRRYHATVRPWLWFLTRTTDCRIFQDQTVPDILKAVFADHGVADFKFELTSSYRTRTYCVQYRETDFNFVSRLLEHEGIGYHFRHSLGHNTLVLTDSTSMHTPVPGYETLSFISSEEQVRPELEHVRSWGFSREIQPGVYVHDDYDPERPSVELKTSKSLPRNYTPSDYEIYDYPGFYQQKPDGEQYAAVRIDELGSQFEFAQGKTNARGLSVGALLTLEDHPRADQNHEYLIVTATCELLFENYESLPDPRPTNYDCSFTVMPSSQQYRPARRARQPFVQGPQTAVVVGPAAEEIFTDEHGRVRVQFHWDRRGANDEHSSCWIRVSQFWAGKGWGALHLPRIGHEVIVDFLEGDPDQPIVIGRVYNGINVPPYKLPENKTQSGVKSRSSLQGTPENFNEIRFEDKKGSEEFFMQAEKTMTIKVKAGESHSVGGGQSVSVGGNQATKIKKDHNVEVTEGGYNISVKKKQMFIDVPEAQFHVHGKKIWHIAEEEFTADVHGNTIRMDTSSVSITGKSKITLTCGGSSIELTPGGITITSSGPVEVKGLPIKLNS